MIARKDAGVVRDKAKVGVVRGHQLKELYECGVCRSRAICPATSGMKEKRQFSIIAQAIKDRSMHGYCTKVGSMHDDAGDKDYHLIREVPFSAFPPLARCKQANPAQSWRAEPDPWQW